MKKANNHPIEQWRLISGYSQSELSEKLGITRQTYRLRIIGKMAWKITELNTLSIIVPEYYLNRFKKEILKLIDE
jgi:transcriptional regulator with XRE-family HTH domain